MHKGNKNHTFGISFWVGTFFTLLMIEFVCFFPYWFTGEDSLDFRNTGQIGDTIGGIMGPFIAIIASLLTFMAFWVQYKANQQQRMDMALERFENNLFQMISQQESITDNLRYSSDGSSETLASGRAVFEYIYHHRQKGWHKGLRTTILEEGIMSMRDENGLWCLDHYFRHLYRIFKYIDEAPIFHDDSKRLENSYSYTSIVRSMLSEYELVFLYYNGLSHDDLSKFKRLIERYALLNNLRFNLLATAYETEYYTDLLQDRNVSVPGFISNAHYSKGAFSFSITENN